MISLTQILDQTTPFLPRLIAYENGIHSFTNLSFITRKQQCFNEGILYIGLASQLGELHYVESAAMLLVMDCDQPFAGIALNNMVIVGYPRETDAFQLFNQVKQLFYREWDFLNGSFKLLDIFLKADNLNALAEMIAKFVHNPIQIMDASYHVLAYSRSCKTTDSPWNETNERGYFTYEYVSAIYRHTSFKTLPNDNTPYYNELDISPLRRLISKIYLNDHHLGYLVTLEANQNLAELDNELYKQISNVCAKAILFEKKMRTYKGGERSEYLLTDLLEGTIDSKSVFLSRIRDTHFKKGAVYQLIAIDITKYAHADATDSFLKRSLEALFPRSWSFHYKNHVVVLVETKSDSGILPEARLALEKLCRDNTLCAGLSDAFSVLYNLRLFYSQALSALFTASLLQAAGNIFEYEDYKFYDILLTLRNANKNAPDLKYYCSSTVMQIQAYDKKHGTDYFKTLWTYLNTNKNLIKTAQALYIHKNTAAYRIQKLKELFAIDMENDFAMFKLYYSYLLLTCADFR
ncbi:PucR family transcriptional regulator [Sporomusa termitida]|uniref:PucR C-terminal helix-turn-helix domain-containing protein n=1 Tax=Sporomusa termitida TaxID=2377 RepID=A0A517DV87_9FIRM|nr:helix-turn-helix domain-containing protein [Sporomusa termitida]QDR81186.1 hypothetical protein SPTER_25600 [Sporomusa termitida]